jgi:outer membrane protein
MNNIMRILVVLSLALAVATGAQAQESLNLDKAVGIALEQNQMLRGATQDLEVAHWGKLNAVSNYLPKVEIASSITKIDAETDARSNAAIDFIKSSAGMLGVPAQFLTNLRPFAYLNTYGTMVQVVQPIYNGGAEALSIRAADAQSDKSEYSFEDAQQDVIARVKMSYYNVLKAEELLNLAQESAARTSRYLESTRRKADVGMRTRTDVQRWEVQQASSEGTLINAQNFVAAARLQLNEVMGVELNKDFVLEKVVNTDSTDGNTALLAPKLHQAAPESGQSVTPDLLEMHPSMKIMETNLRLADLGISKSWVNFQPRINLAFQYGWERNNTLALDGYNPWTLALTVSWPIFSGFSDYTNLEKARYEFKRTEAQVEGFKRGLMLQARNAEMNVRAARQRIEAARKGKDQALDVLNSVTRRYETGGASNVDLIDVQTAYTSARTDYITAMYDYYIASVQLARATGTIRQ